MNEQMAIKIFFNYICIGFLIKKVNRISNISRTQLAKCILLSLITVSLHGILVIVLKESISVGVISLIMYFTYGLANEYILKQYTSRIVSNTLTILLMLYISFFCAGIVNFALKKTGKILYGYIEIMEFIILGILQFLLIYFFFKIQRFKDGFPFFSQDVLYRIIGILSSICVASIAIIMRRDINNRMIKRIIFILILLMTVFVFNWIKKCITKYYKKQMKDRTVEMLKEQVEEKDRTINELKEELANVLKVNHKYNHRISAMEKAVIQLSVGLKDKEEFAEEFSNMEEMFKDLSCEYRNELYSNTNNKNQDKTGVYSVDQLLGYMSDEANKKRIKILFEIDTNITEMIQGVIPKNRLETLLGDHIKDAIIAVEHSDSDNKKILVKFNENYGIYEVAFYDTGIEFEIDTLLRLGIENVTTHKQTGGTGIGFMTTFDTMKQTGASLIITEYGTNSGQEYTKVVTIRFDGKGEYKINSYREEKIRKESTRKDLIFN